MKKNKFQVAIIGAGLSGGMAGYHLASRGLHTVIADRDSETPHRVCGEFFSGPAQMYLRDIGLDPMALGAIRISRFRLHGPERSAEANLPVAGFGISRRVLDAAVIHQAERAGAEVRWNSSAIGLDSSSAEFLTTELSDGEIQSDSVCLATGQTPLNTGKPRRLRDSGWIGVKTHIKVRPSVYSRLRESVSVYAFDGGYGVLTPIEKQKVNFCFILRRNLWRQVPHDFRAIGEYIARHNWQASRDLDSAEPLINHLLINPSLQVGRPARRSNDPRIYHLGDQLSSFPTLFGDGLCVAMDSARLAAEMLTNPSTRSAHREYERRVYARTRIPHEVAVQLGHVLARPRFADWMAFGMQRAPWTFKPCYFATRVGFGTRPTELDYLKSSRLEFQTP